MKYLKFDIENYKGIQNTTIELSGEKDKIITLVGLNESGKTTILEAIDFLVNDPDENLKHKIIPKSKKFNFNGKIRVTGTLIFERNERETISSAVCKEFDFKEIVQLPEKITISKYFEYANSQYQSKLTSWSISLKAKSGKQKSFREIEPTRDEWKFLLAQVEKNVPKIIYYENFLFNIPHEILIHPYSKIDNKELPFYDMLQDILDSIDTELSIDEHLVDRIGEPDEANQGALNATLNKMGGKVTHLVLKPWGEIMDTKDKRIKFYSRIEKNKFSFKQPNGSTKSEDAYYIRFELEDGDETYPISERSLGFRWFFAFLLFTELRKHRYDDPGETLFLLDEPASNLHSTAQKKLLDIFNELVNEGSKLIYTTHSHHLINPKYLESAYIVKNLALNYADEMNYDSAKTLIEATLYKRFVSLHPEQVDYFKPILDVLDYQPGLLEMIPKLTVLEGKHDYYSFHYINSVVLNDEYKIFAYPGFGAGKNDNLIALYLSWNREFNIILDSDHRGKKENERYKEEFGVSLQDKVFTYFDVDNSWNNYKIESLYTEEDIDKIMQSIKPNYQNFSKKLFHLEIQNLLALNRDIGISETTKSNFRKVFEFLGYAERENS